MGVFGGGFIGEGIFEYVNREGILQRWWERFWEEEIVRVKVLGLQGFVFFMFRSNREVSVVGRVREGQGVGIWGQGLGVVLIGSGLRRSSEIYDVQRRQCRRFIYSSERFQGQFCVSRLVDGWWEYREIFLGEQLGVVQRGEEGEG